MSPTRSIYDDNASLYLVVGGVVLVLVFAFTALALLRGTRRRPGDPSRSQGAPRTTRSRAPTSRCCAWSPPAW